MSLALTVSLLLVSLPERLLFLGWSLAEQLAVLLAVFGCFPVGAGYSPITPLSGYLAVCIVRCSR